MRQPKKSSNTYFDLSIVIPALREEKRIGKTLDALARLLDHDALLKTLSVEVLVVAADSPDKTHQIVLSKKSNFKNLTLLKPGPKVGKGRDVQYGMVRALGAAIIFMDADLATPLHHLPKFYRAYTKGNDVVIGTRNLLKHHPNKIRRLLSNAGNILFRIVSGIWVEDSQCGFKLFSNKAAKLCFSKLTIMGWGFDMEILAIAKANKLKIISYRINDWVSVPDSKFNESIIANSLVSLKDLSKILVNRVRRSYLQK